MRNEKWKLHPATRRVRAEAEREGETPNRQWRRTQPIELTKASHAAPEYFMPHAGGAEPLLLLQGEGDGGRGGGVGGGTLSFSPSSSRSFSVLYT